MRVPSPEILMLIRPGGTKGNHMSPRVRSDDPDGSAALNREARGAWNVLVLIGAILGGAGVVSGSAYGLSLFAAERVVAPTSARLELHVHDQETKEESNKAYKERTDQTLALINRKLDAICRASAHPEACLQEK